MGSKPQIRYAFYLDTDGTEFTTIETTTGLIQMYLSIKTGVYSGLSHYLTNIILSCVILVFHMFITL